MKVLVLLSFVALCCSTPLTVNRHVSVREDGIVTIIDSQNREMYITGNVIDPRKVDIVLKSPLGAPRKMEIDEANNIRDVDFNTLDTIKFTQNPTYLTIPRDQVTQVNILKDLFREYEGVVNEKSYETLLEKIRYLVKSGVIHESVLDVLKNFEQWHMMKGMRNNQMITQSDMSLESQMIEVRTMIDLLNQYKTVMNGQSYETLLENIMTLIKSGVIRGTVFDVLKNLRELHILQLLKDSANWINTPQNMALESQMAEHGILVEFFHQYEQIVNEETYEMFMEKVHTLVKSGQIHASNVFDVLKYFEQLYLIKLMKNPNILMDSETYIALDNLLTQDPIFANLFRQYKEEPNREVIVQTIKYLVKTGTIHGTVFEILTKLDKLHLLHILKARAGESDNVLLKMTYAKKVVPLEYSQKIVNPTSLEGQMIEVRTVVDLVSQYKTVMDGQSYKDLLERIMNLVKSGVIRGTVYDVLKNLRELHILQLLKHSAMWMNTPTNVALESQMEQGGLLVELFHQYEQIVNEETYENFMEKVQTLVKSEQIEATNVFDVLKYFEQLYLIKLMKNPLILMDSETYVALDNLLTRDMIFADLFRQYKEEPNREVIIEKVKLLVKNGVLHGTVFEILTKLDKFYLLHILKARASESTNVLPMKTYNKKVLSLENSDGVMHQAREVRPVQGVVPEYLRNYGIENMSPIQHSRMLSQQYNRKRESFLNNIYLLNYSL